MQWHLDGARAQAAARAEVAATLAPLDARRDAARTAAETTAEKAVAARTVLAERAGQISRELRQAWDRDRPLAADAVRTVDAGPGRLHQRARQVRTAQQQLDQWADTWRPVLDLAAQPGGVVRFAGRDPGWDRIDEPINVYAQARAQSELPALAAVVHAADTARQRAQQAADDFSTAYTRLQHTYGYGLAGYRIARHTDHGDREDPETIARLSEQTARARDRADTADRRVQRLTHDPALTARPDADTVLATARNRWEDAIGSATHPTVDATVSGRDRMSSHDHEPPDFGYGLDRAGPSIGM